MNSQTKHAFPDAVPEERRDTPRHVARYGYATLESPIFLEKVPVVDIGRLGFSVRTTVTYAQGSRLILHFPGQPPLSARAVWHARNRLGARFDVPLDQDVLTSLIGEG
jgi:hypothetical protein